MFAITLLSVILMTIITIAAWKDYNEREEANILEVILPTSILVFLLWMVLII